MSKNETFSVRKLSKELGIDRATAAKVVKGIATEEEARAALTTWKEARDKAPGERDSITGLSWWQAYMREKVLLARAARDREQQLAGGELVPVNIIRTAAEVASGRFHDLANALYVLGIPGIRVGGEFEPRIERLGQEFVSDFTGYIHQWLDRQDELAPPPPPVKPGDMMPVTEYLALMRAVVNVLEGVPAELKKRGLSREQAEMVRALLDEARRRAIWKQREI